MKTSDFLIFCLLIFISSCSTKNQLLYLKDADEFSINKIEHKNNHNLIEIGDILKIDVMSIVPEAAQPFNKPLTNSFSNNNLNILKLDGYLVNNDAKIKFPIIGNIAVTGHDIFSLEKKITKLLIEGGHLTNPLVKVRRLNSKFTLLGEIKNPGTYSYQDKSLNIFQAIGYGGDLTILGKRKNITLIRQSNNLRVVHKIDLTDATILSKPYFEIKNNDVIIVDPNFSKVKSAGFIGSAASIASVATLLLNITLLLIN